MTLKDLLIHTKCEAEDHIQYCETNDERDYLNKVIKACDRELREL